MKLDVHDSRGHQEDIEVLSSPQNHTIAPPPFLSSRPNGSSEGSRDPSELVTAMLVAQPQPSGGNWK